jgi:tetratricopeptide (TPR) repeat protein
LFGKKSVSRRTGQAAGRIFLLIMLLAPLSGTAASDLPGWVLFEKGLALFEEGRLDEALEMITLSAGGSESNPEVLYWTGRIYEAEGDYLLAEMRYREALDKSRFLYVPDQKWAIYYSLSDIYINQMDYGGYEQILLTVFDEEMKRNTEIIRREHSYVQMLKSDGLDKLLLLYRLKLSYALEASERLGRFYNGRELWKSSLIKNLYTMLSYFTAGIELLISDAPDFSFPVDMEEAWETDPEFLVSAYEGICARSGRDFSFSRNLTTLEPDRMAGDRKRAEEMIRMDFQGFRMTPSLYTLLKMEEQALRGGSLKLDGLYASLFFLGEALYQEGNPERAEDLWSLLAMSGNSSSWKTLAEKKIENPDLKTPFLKY